MTALLIFSACLTGAILYVKYKARKKEKQDSPENEYSPEIRYTKNETPLLFTIYVRKGRCRYVREYKHYNGKVMLLSVVPAVKYWGSLAALKHEQKFRRKRLLLNLF